MTLSDASDTVLGTLGLALLLVAVPALWTYVGSVYVRLISQDALGKALEIVDDSWRFIYRIRLIIYIVLFNYPSSVAIFFLAQLVWGVAPYRILWQTVGAAALSIPNIDGGSQEIKSADDKQTKTDKRRFNYTRRRKQLVAIVQVVALIFITDRGSRSAQQATVILTIWILSLAGVKSALYFADKSRYGYYISEGIAADVHIPVWAWVALSVGFTVSTLVIATRALVAY